MATDAPIVVLFADDQIPGSEAVQDDATFDRIVAIKSVTREQFDEDLAWFKNLLRELRNEGFELHTANTFAEAKQQIAAVPFDVAIIDRSWTGDPDLPPDDRDGAGRKLVHLATKLRPQSRVICLSQDFRDKPHRMSEAYRDGALPLPKLYDTRDAVLLIETVRFLVERTDPPGSEASAERLPTEHDAAWAILRGHSQEQLEEELRWLKVIRRITSLVMVLAVVVVLAAACALWRGDHDTGQRLLTLGTSGLVAQTGLLGWLWVKATKQREAVRRTMDDLRKLAAGPTGYERIRSIEAIAGTWWQAATTTRDSTALSLIEVLPISSGTSVFVKGRSWTRDGTETASWSSRAVELGTREHEIELFYAWRGRHAKEVDGEAFTGSGALTFTRNDAEAERADGWYTTTNHRYPEQTEFKLCTCGRATEDELTTLDSPDGPALIQGKLLE